jgi:hypothetical protein
MRIYDYAAMMSALSISIGKAKNIHETLVG